MTQQSKSEIHVCIISEQPIPNLLPLIFERPNKAIFLVSSEMKIQAKRLKKVVKQYGIDVEEREIIAYDFDAVSKMCEDILKSYNEQADGNITLNVTGGTKIAALAAFQIFYFSKRRIIYLDTAHNKIIQLSPESQSISLKNNLIKMNDYLNVYGKYPSDNNAVEQKREGLNDLVKFLVENEKYLGNLNYQIGQYSNKEKTYARISIDKLSEQSNINVEKLINLWEICGVARRMDLNTIEIQNVFFCQGGWLEEYVYWTIKSMGIKGLRPQMNVKVQWDEEGNKPTKERKKTTKNEFDVLFTYCNRLYFISCKTSNPKQAYQEDKYKVTESLNELFTLSDQAGGIYSKAMLVSARTIDDYAQERAKKMKIEVVHGNEVLNLKERIGKWLDLYRNEHHDGDCQPIQQPSYL
jgi:hypothetical protein